MRKTMYTLAELRSEWNRGCTTFSWHCNFCTLGFGQCHQDYEGCNAQSRGRPFRTLQAAQKAAQSHLDRKHGHARYSPRYAVRATVVGYRKDRRTREGFKAVYRESVGS